MYYSYYVFIHKTYKIVTYIYNTYITDIFLELGRAANILLTAFRRYCTEVPGDKKDLMSMKIVENRLFEILEAKENIRIAGQRRANSLTSKHHFKPKFGQLVRKNTI